MGWSSLSSNGSTLEKVPRGSLSAIIYLSTSVARSLNKFQDRNPRIFGCVSVAMAAVFFLRVKDTDSDTRVTFVCSKTRVAPLKKLTIPRLELSAAVLLAKLTKYVQDYLDLSKSPVFLWTDSSVSLVWVNSHPSRWKEFVRNRVILIQELLPQGQWSLILGKENPAVRHVAYPPLNWLNRSFGGLDHHGL